MRTDQLVSKNTSRSFPEEEYDEESQIEIECNTEDELSTTSSDSDDVEVFEMTDAGSGESWVRI